tara:strand:+ start:728 stop:1093 length:366 start_codon:yes stop_codon:yes gene_type:complete
MARQRVTKSNRRNPQQNPRNAGLNRATAMRGNARNIGANRAFQGGLSPMGQVPGQPPQQNRQQCPPGQQPGPVNPSTGAPTCVPARQQPNIASQVPIQNSHRAGAGVPAPTRNKPPLKEGY